LLIEGLKKISKVKIYGTEDMENRAPVVSFNIEEEGSSQISFQLDREYEIATRAGLHCAPLAHETIGTLEQGTVRISLGYFNTKEEIIEVLKAIKEIANN